MKIPDSKCHIGPYSQRRDRECLDKEILAASLPNVGDTVMQKPTILTVGNVKCKLGLYEGIVTYVNKEKLWYEVKFTDGPTKGMKESYNIPEVSDYPFTHKQEVLHAGDRIAHAPKKSGRARKNGYYCRLGD